MTETVSNEGENDEEEIVSYRRESLLTSNSEKSLQKNKESVLKFMKKMLPRYFSSEWSFKQIKIGGGKEKITK